MRSASAKTASMSCSTSRIGASRRRSSSSRVRALRALLPHAGHRLVEQQGLGAERQRDGDLELPAFAMRQFGRRRPQRGPARPTRSSAAIAGSVRPPVGHDAARRSGSSSPAGLHGQHDVAQRRKLQRQRRYLEGAAEPEPRPRRDVEARLCPARGSGSSRCPASECRRSDGSACVLPAPFGPISAWISPGLRSRLTSSVAFSAPKLFDRSADFEDRFSHGAPARQRGPRSRRARTARRRAG